MDCSRIRNYVHGYIDRELDPVVASEIERHLEGCASCRQAYARQSMLQAAVKRHAAYHAAPASLAGRIRAKAPGTDAREMAVSGDSRRQWLRLGAAVAATAVVTWVIALQVERTAKDDRVVEELIAGHARAVLTNHLVDVASSDQHTVKPWLSSRLDFSPPVADLADAGFPLVGGRLDYLANRPVAALVFRHRQHVINLFVWPDANARAAAPARVSSKQGYNVWHWAHAGMTFWAISDLGAADVGVFSETYAGIK
jgi:anti-sigma factor RsiW